MPGPDGGPTCPALKPASNEGLYNYGPPIPRGLSRIRAAPRMPGIELDNKSLVERALCHSQPNEKADRAAFSAELRRKMATLSRPRTAASRRRLSKSGSAFSSTTEAIN